MDHTADWWLGDLTHPWFLELERAIRDEWGAEPMRVREGGVRHVSNPITLLFFLTITHHDFLIHDSLYPASRSSRKPSAAPPFIFLWAKARYVFPSAARLVANHLFPPFASSLEYRVKRTCRMSKSLCRICDRERQSSSGSCVRLPSAGWCQSRSRVGLGGADG